MKRTTIWLTTFLVGLNFTLTTLVHSAPVLVKGNNLTISIFKTTKRNLSPFLVSGFDAVPDEHDNYRVFLGAVTFNDTFGVEPFSEFIVFTEVKPKGEDTDNRYFLPIWGASDSAPVSEIYSEQFGLPIEHVDNLQVVVNHKGQNTRVEGRNAINGNYKVSMTIIEASNEIQTNFSNAYLIGEKDGKTMLNKDIFAAKFRSGKIDTLIMKANRKSPLQLLEKKNHIYTLFSDNHSTYIE